jgi:hypothetical protein
MEFETLSFEDALGYFEGHLEEAEKVGIKADICLAPIGDVYELLGNFFEGEHGGTVGLENEYVTEAVAMRLAVEFNVPILITADSMEEFDAIMNGTELDELYGVPT